SNRFSEIIFNLMAGGALGSAFIPTFTGLLTTKNRPGAWKLASSIANLLLLIMVLVSILSWIFAEQIVTNILAPGFEASGQALTVDLLRIQLPSAIIFGLSGLAMGILNAHQHFLMPALAPAMYRIGLIIGALVLSPWMGIKGLAWGVLLGSSMHLLLQLPALLRLPERRYTAALGLQTPNVREVGRLMAPRLIGVAVVQINFLLNTFLASFQAEGSVTAITLPFALMPMPDGSVTAITLSFALMLMPQAAIAQSIAIAALPTFSAQVARGRKDEMRASLAATLRGVLFLAIPASLGLILLREPLVSVIYERNAFNQASTQLVAWALLWYAAGLVGHSLVEILSRAFYALHDTKTPVVVGVITMSLNLLLSIAFTWLFARVGWMPHGGLALANSLATALESIALIYLMRRRLNGLLGYTIWQAVGKACLAAACMSVCIWVWLKVSPVSNLLLLLGGVLAGGLLYVILLWVLRVSELQRGLGFVRSFISGRRKG
ncbi:MAG: murein biosynthesis integral membrane protein MurJ, partial [Anaerolineaceae bacterium]|nr:murein biosynthesis integral membrane protein MurJ [Anaerolineaceae bacterium]